MATNIKKLKFITKENLETFAKNLYIPTPEAKTIKKFTLNTYNKLSTTVDGIIFTLSVKNSSSSGYGYGYGYGSDNIGEYFCQLKANKNCLVLISNNDEDQFFIDCSANTLKTISVDSNEKSFDIFLLGTYNLA